MKKVKKKPVEKTRKKKHYKATIIMLSFFLVLIMGGFFVVGAIMLNIHSDSLYPTNVLVQSDISAFARTMEYLTYKPLNEIAISIANDGAGPMLSPIGGSKEFDYEGDVLVKLTTSTGSGRIIVRQGTGNIQNDIVSSTPYYYDFMGKLNPVYKEKVIESGQLNNYQAEYSAGYIDTGNFIKENGYYVIALECSASENGRYLFIVYATESQKELRNMVGLLKDFASLALEGDASEGNIDDRNDDDYQAEGDDEEWNAYLEENRVDESQQVSVGELQQAASISGNAVDNLEIPQDTEEPIDLQMEEE